MYVRTVFQGNIREIATHAGACHVDGPARIDLQCHAPRGGGSREPVLILGNRQRVRRNDLVIPSREMFKNRMKINQFGDGTNIFNLAPGTAESRRHDSVRDRSNNEVSAESRRFFFPTRFDMSDGDIRLFSSGD